MTLLYRRSGRPLPGLWKHLGLPSSGGLRGREPERKRALSTRAARQKPRQEGKGVTHGVAGTALSSACSGGPPPICLKRLQVRLRLSCLGTLVDWTRHHGPQESLAVPKEPWGGRAQNEKSQGAGGAKGPARPQAVGGKAGAHLVPLSHPPSRPQKTAMRELCTHRDPRQKCSLCTGDPP